ncbi:MAG: hypothetical protein R2742_08635 [Micropruina glycogenica]
MLTVDDIVAAIRYVVARCTKARKSAASSPTDDIDHFGNRRLRTVGELIQNQQPASVWAGLRAHRSRTYDHARHRGDHAADADQHPPGVGGAEGVLRQHLAVEL